MKGLATIWPFFSWHGLNTLKIVRDKKKCPIRSLPQAFKALKVTHNIHKYMHTTVRTTMYLSMYLCQITIRPPKGD